MGRNKTRKKQQRSGQTSEDPDPDISETEPSSSDNVSNSLNETMVLNNSNNVMDTDIEDSEQTTAGDTTPADETEPFIVVPSSNSGETFKNPFESDGGPAVIVREDGQTAAAVQEPEMSKKSSRSEEFSTLNQGRFKFTAPHCDSDQSDDEEGPIRGSHKGKSSKDVVRGSDKSRGEDKPPPVLDRSNDRPGCLFSPGNNASTSTSTKKEVESNRLNQWLDDQNESRPPSVDCTHVKNSTSLPGLRKSLKNDIVAECSARPCSERKQQQQNSDDANATEDKPSGRELWMCLQCGNIGCGDEKALGGDAEAHYKAPRSDQHNIVLRFTGDMEKSWCYSCKTFVDIKHSYLKDAIQLIKRHPKVKQLQSKAKTGAAASIIALGPPPPPPQPEISTDNTRRLKVTEFRNCRSIKSAKNRESGYASNSSRDNSNRDEWPLGLENLGNTCFMNSALQCLSRTKTLIPKLDLYGTGNTIEILVTADPPTVEVIGTVTSDTNGDNAASLFSPLSPTDGGGLMEESEGTNGSLSNTDGENGGSSPSSSEMDSLLDVASSKSSPSKESTPTSDAYKDEIEKELKKSLRLRLTIPKDSMTARLRHAFKAMTRSADVQPGNVSSYGGSEYFGRGRHVFTPSAIHNAMAKNFRPGQQHDSHELLRTVVDMMKKDQIKAFRLAIMQCYGLKKSDGKNCDPKVAELLKQWDRKLYHKTFVDEIFGGELVTFQTCLTCQAVRRSHEDFLDISLPIRVYTKNQVPKRAYSLFDDDGDSNRSLEDCLKSFIEPEQLTGSNAVECEKCHKRNLEKLANGASFEEVFPGVKPPPPPPTVTPPEPSAKVLEPPNKTKLDALFEEAFPGGKPPTLQSTVTPPEPMAKVGEPALETEMDASVMEEDSCQNFGTPTEDMDDLDEPAVDGFIGNTSDMEDEGNGVPPVFLPSYNTEEDRRDSTADFINSSDLQSKENMSLSLAATHDEGFSESDSSEEKKSASISASSSRNSISEAENNGGAVASSSNSLQKNKETTKPIPITKCPCSRRQMVLRPPECLTVHLKRFQITSHGTSKLSDRVNFPYILNLTPFCARDDEDLRRLDNNGHNVYDEDGEVKYALYGIVEHSGSLHWGHYVAYIKVPGQTQTSPKGTTTENTSSTSAIEVEADDNDEGTNNSVSSSSSEVTPDKWYYISDSSVSPSSLESVLGMDPYILFYERIRGQEKKDRQNQLERLINPTSTCSSTSLTFEPSAASSSTSTTTSTTAETTTNYNNDSSTSAVNYSLD